MTKFRQQYDEVRNLYDGQPVDIIEESFGSNITNRDDDYIDANYRDILVTFNIRDGRAYLSDIMFECYDEHGMFIGTERV